MHDLLRYLEGVRHLRRRGHWPDWIELNEALLRRQCVKCLSGGHRARPRLVLMPTAR